MSNSTENNNQDVSTDSTQRIPESMRKDIADTPPETDRTQRIAADQEQGAKAPGARRVTEGRDRRPPPRPPAPPASRSARPITAPRPAVASVTTNGSAPGRTVSAKLVNPQIYRKPVQYIDPRYAQRSSLWGPLLLGLLLLLLVGWFATRHYTPVIEKDLLKRSTAALDEQGLADNAVVMIDGRTATLKGTVSSTEQRTQAETLVDATFGIRSVDNQLKIAGADTGGQSGTVVEGRDNSALSMDIESGKVTLTGAVPAKHFADRLQAAAEETYGAGNVDNQISIERTGTTNPGWLDAAEGLMPELASIDNAQIDISDRTLTLKGETADWSQKETIGTLAKDLAGTRLEIENLIDASAAEAAARAAAEAEAAAKAAEEKAAAEAQAEAEAAAKVAKEAAAKAAAEAAAKAAAKAAAEAEAAALAAKARVASTLRLRGTDDGVTVNGILPDEATRTAILDQVRANFSGNITDNIRIDGAADDAPWAAGLSAPLAEIATLEDPELDINDVGLFLSGTTYSLSRRQAIEDSLQALAPDLSLDSTVYAVPNTPASLELHIGDGEISIGGQLSTEAADQIISANVRARPQDSILNMVTLDDSTVTPDWIDAIEASVSKLEDLENGGLTVHGDTLTVAGVASDADAKQRIATEISTLFGENLSLRNEITVAESIIVTPDINELLTGIDLQGIRFARNSDKLTNTSQQIVEQVATALQSAPTVNVLIGGHTDSWGDYDYNLDLSAARANTVRESLISQGVSANRLTTTGFGPDFPVADNDSQQGRAQNRRIEFQIITGD